jgi:hypothetical protein
MAMYTLDPSGPSCQLVFVNIEPPSAIEVIMFLYELKWCWQHIQHALRPAVGLMQGVYAGDFFTIKGLLYQYKGGITASKQFTYLVVNKLLMTF